MNKVTASYDHPAYGKLTVTFTSWATNLVAQGVACVRALEAEYPSVHFDVNKVCFNVR